MTDNSEDEEVTELQKKNCKLQKKLLEKEKEIKHLKLVISNLEGTGTIIPIECF